MGTDQMKAVVRQFLDDVWTRGDLDACTRLIAPTHVHHFGSRDLRGPEGVKQLVGGLRTSFPDLRIDIDDLIAEGDTVAVRMTIRGTDQGGFMGRPPTGATVNYAGVDFFRVVDGKIVERWGVVDSLALQQQLTNAPAT